MGQSQIEDHEGIFLAGQCGVRVIAAMNTVDHIVVAPQQTGDPLRQVLIVFHE